LEVAWKIGFNRHVSLVQEKQAKKFQVC